MPNFPIVNDGIVYVNGLCLSSIDTTTLGVTAGAARNSSNINDIVVDQNLVIDINRQGANGIDTGTVAPSTWYAVYAIGDSTRYLPGAAVFSADFSAPSLPGGYDMYQLTGVFLTDGSSLIEPFVQYGDGLDRSFYKSFGNLVLTAGAAVTSTAVDLSAGVPPIKAEVYGLVVFTPAVATDTVQFGAVPVATTFRMGTGVAATQTINMTLPSNLVGSVPTLYYMVTGGSVNLTTVGFSYSLC